MRLAVEVGGTSIRIAVAEVNNLEGESKPGCTLKHQTQIQNKGYDFVLQSIKDHLESLNEDLEISSVGISSFGPICLNKSSPKYGQILVGACDVKKTWLDKSLALDLKNYFGLDLDKVFVDTDVNGAAIAESVLGNHPSVLPDDNLIYITVGTGVGVGVLINGVTVKGIQHPEAGHMICQIHSKDLENEFSGPCNFHNNCVENFVTNYAIAKRLGLEIDQLPDVEDENEIWDIVGFYLAQLCCNIALLASPKAIVIGGGVMNRKMIYKYVRENVVKLLNGYIEVPEMENYIREASLKDSGLVGAALMTE